MDANRRQLFSIEIYRPDHRCQTIIIINTTYYMSMEMETERDTSFKYVIAINDLTLIQNNNHFKFSLD